MFSVDLVWIEFETSLSTLCWDHIPAPPCLAGIKIHPEHTQGMVHIKPQQAVYKIYCQQKTAEAPQEMVFPIPFRIICLQQCLPWGFH